MMGLDYFHETLISRCARCGVVTVHHSAYTSATGISARECKLTETDEQLRKRLLGGGPRINARMTCGGRLHQVANHDAVLAVHRLGDWAAVLAMIEGAS